MSDIVARLRAEWPEIRDAKDAADEIERLRAEVERLTRDRDDLDARLTELFASSVSYIRKKHDAVARAEAAERKVEKLRESLSRMLLEVDFMVEHEVIPDVRGDIIYENARAALKETEQ